MNKNNRRKRYNPYKRKKRKMIMARTMAEISRDYQEKAALAGHIYYQIEVQEEALERVVDDMRKLNSEAEELKKSEPVAQEQDSGKAEHPA